MLKKGHNILSEAFPFPWTMQCSSFPLQKKLQFEIFPLLPTRISLSLSPSLGFANVTQNRSYTFVWIGQQCITDITNWPLSNCHPILTGSVSTWMGDCSSVAAKPKSWLDLISRRIHWLLALC